MRPLTRNLAASAAVLLVLLGAAAGCGKKEDRSKEGGASEERSAPKYYCPMHPTYTSDKPGDCPICNMRLEVMPEPSGADDSGHAEGEGSGGAHGAGGPGGASPPGYAALRISPEKQQLIGVRTERASVGSASATIRTAGKVEYDERGLHHVHTKVDGWIGKLYVSYTGQAVERGQPLFTLYSPEIVATQEEYLLALREAQKGGIDAAPGDDLVESVEKRLLLWDIHHPEIEKIAAAGEPETYVDIMSHVSGVVIEKKALEGMRAMSGEDLYLIADLSNVWVTASIYEYELPSVRIGQEADITLASLPGETVTGRITYIYPYLDEMTRTARVRLEFENPRELLKPGMYAKVEIRTPAAEGLTIPADAVLDSGERQIVFVAKGNGYFEPRAVRIGERMDGRVTVLSGIEPDEEVVVGAQFLLDSESQLKAALDGMGASGEHRH